jgi:hypothetical protein
LLTLLIVAAIAAGNHPVQAVTLQFAGRNWKVKQASNPVGPGPNRFSSSPQDVWSDQQGLHLTIQRTGPYWYSTEVILDESLGYGTYLFQTTSRQDIFNANATFGAFTWDTFGDSPIPNSPHREIDFEDARWGNASDPANSQVVVQPYYVAGNLERITLPDLSQDARLTRFFKWSPGKIEFYSLLGHHSPTKFPAEAVIHHLVYLDNQTTHRVPEPGRENFRFNLWLFRGVDPVGNQPVEVVINDFAFLPLLPGDFDNDRDVDGFDRQRWEGDFGLNRHSDADGDGDSDGADFLTWQRHVGRVAPLLATISVPEPGAWQTLLSAILCGGPGRYPRWQPRESTPSP